MNPTQEYRYNECAIKTYDDAKAFFAKCRTPDKGRHLKNWARLHPVTLEDGTTAYEVRANGKGIVRFLPDNTLEFVCNSLTARETSITLSQALQRAVPFYWIRIATGRYRVEHIKQMKYNESQSPTGHWWEDGQHLRTKAPEFFEGIKFDLTTGECLNRKPDILTQVIPEKRKAWLSDLRKFKKQVKIRAKMGVFDSLLKTEYDRRIANRKGYEMPDWTSDHWVKLLASSIKDTQVPMELMVGLAQSCHVSYWSPRVPTREDVLKALEHICTEQSVYLRREYGVFDETNTEVGAN
jgi:hypothetical protein